MNTLYSIWSTLAVFFFFPSFVYLLFFYVFRLNPQFNVTTLWTVGNSLRECLQKCSVSIKGSQNLREPLCVWEFNSGTALRPHCLSSNALWSHTLSECGDWRFSLSSFVSQRTYLILPFLCVCGQQSVLCAWCYDAHMRWADKGIVWVGKLSKSYAWLATSLNRVELLREIVRCCSLSLSTKHKMIDYVSENFCLV